MLFFSPPWDSVVYWALDLETGGLDPGKDPIVAVGMVPLRGGTIKLGDAYRSLVRPEEGKSIDPRSMGAHQLVAGEVRDAPALGQVLREIDQRIRETVLLVHHKALDVGFLRLAYRRHGMRWPSPPVVDTVDLLFKAAKRLRFASREPSEGPAALNLSLARREYGLPDYQAHDALTDAVAAAELFLVLRNVLGARTLRDLR